MIIKGFSFWNQIKVMNVHGGHQNLMHGWINF